jgi:phosphoribosyl-ATP pyrophosphohydrolase
MAKGGAKKTKASKPAVAPASKPRRAVDRPAPQPLPPAVGPADGAAILERLWETVDARRASGDVRRSHSARLLARGRAKVAQKLGEEAVECVIEAALGRRDATVLESADLLYHLIVLWVDAGIRPAEVWQELARRQGISGLAEKAARPRALIRSAGTGKLP